MQVECDGIGLEAPGFKPRKVQHVAERVEQAARRFQQRLGMKLLRFIERRSEQKLGHSRDRLHRRPELMANSVKQFGLCLVSSPPPAPYAPLLSRRRDAGPGHQIVRVGALSLHLE